MPIAVTPVSMAESHAALGQNASVPLLDVQDLRIEFFGEHAHGQAVRGVTLRIDPGETVALVGESGSGKSVTAQSLIGIVDPPGQIVGGDIRWKGRSVVRGADANRYAASIRGSELAIIFQDPMTSLDPLFTVGTQITEVLRHHMGSSKRAAAVRAVELLDLVGIAAPQRRVKEYPHEFSGGMRQRVMIAMALACEPELLIADEPTTALDVTIQAQVFELLAQLQERLGLAILLITHNLGVVAGFCERIEVMYGGKLVESGPSLELFRRPAHPYVTGLLRAMPKLDAVEPRLIAIEGAPPDLRAPPSGCPFHPRCELAEARCIAEMPPLEKIGKGRRVACWRPFDSNADLPESAKGSTLHERGP